MRNSERDRERIRERGSQVLQHIQMLKRFNVTIGFRSERKREREIRENDENGNDPNHILKQ